MLSVQADSRRCPAIQSGTGSTSQLRQMIYVIDDDESVCRAIARLMKSAGLPVRTFVSPRAFLQSVRPTASDCLLVDVHMPEMGGLALQRQLKDSGMRPTIIFITGFDDDATRQTAHSQGAAGYFRKPFDDQALIDAIYFAMSPP